MQSYTKDQFIEYVRIQAGQSSIHTKRMVEATFAAMTTILGRHGEINIAKFAKFGVAPTKEKMARNPKTGEPVLAPASWRVTFKPSMALKNVVKGK